MNASAWPTSAVARSWRLKLLVRCFASAIACTAVLLMISAAPSYAAPRDGHTSFKCGLIYLGGRGFIFYHAKTSCRGASKLMVKAYRSRRSPGGYKCRFYPDDYSCKAKDRSGRMFGAYRENA